MFHEYILYIFYHIYIYGLYLYGIWYMVYIYIYICTLSFGHSLSPLSYSTSKLNLLHSNAIPAPPPPQLRVIKRLQNIIIYIHKCHQNENYLDRNSFCCWCCLMSFKNVCIILSYTVFNLCNKAGWWIRIRGWRGNNHSHNHLVDALKW